LQATEKILTFYIEIHHFLWLDDERHYGYINGRRNLCIALQNHRQKRIYIGLFLLRQSITNKNTLGNLNTADCQLNNSRTGIFCDEPRREVFTPRSNESVSSTCLHQKAETRAAIFEFIEVRYNCLVAAFHIGRAQPQRI